ncbi:MAG: ribonuclease P protein component [Spirochaetaceae bacterium]|nr:MAG: ribonuclease P protein component [Spirochaetaceae bacterium]
MKGRSNLRRVFTEAAKCDRKGIRLYFIGNNLDWNRIAVCPVRGFANAVVRNREKRLCREAYRQLKHKLKSGYDLVFVLYPGKSSLSDRVRQLEALFVRSGLIP